MTLTPRRFAVALSFAGENCAYVEKVAEALLASFDKERIFYDNWHEGEVIGYNSDLKLQNIYSMAELVLPFFSKVYLEKNWYRVEARVIRERLFLQQSEQSCDFAST